MNAFAIILLACLIWFWFVKWNERTEKFVLM